MQINPESEAQDHTECECFQVIAMEWFESIKNQVKESTGNKYWNSLKSYVLPEFGEKAIQEITHDFINEKCNYLLLKGEKMNRACPQKPFPIFCL